MPAPPTVGIILAGGLATRMGGVDKALQRVAGVPILRRLVDSLGRQCCGLLLSANGDPARFAAVDVAVVADDIVGNPGPLAGIAAGLDHIARDRPECRWALTLPGDTPFPPGDLVERLHFEREAAGADLAVAASGDQLHPVIALWPVALRGEMRAFLVEQGERRVRAFVERYRLAVVAWPAEPWDPYLNVNTQEDLAAAEAAALQVDAAVKPAVSR